MAPNMNSRDLATRSGGMDLLKLEDLVRDTIHQPEWRERADTVAAYIDGKQISPLERAEKEDKGEPVSITNLMQRTLNGALGQEAKTRLDWKATSDNDMFRDVGEVINERLHEAQRETYADMAISDAYKSQIGPGLGWVEVSRNPDPLEYPYRVEEVHRNEMWWDWRSRRRDLLDARWLCRQRWVDKDEGETWYPQFKEVFRYACHNGPITDAFKLSLVQSDTFERLHTTRSTFNVNEEEWLDSTRQRIKFYEVWYRVPRIALSLLMPGGQRVEFNERNPIHQALVARNRAQLVKGPSFTIRQAMFAGPFRLSDRATTLRRYPYIPFWCYRDDADRTPYGLGEGMLGPQREYNERRSRLLWLLKAKQIFVDNDALDTNYNDFIDLALEAMRPDAMFVLNAARKNKTGGMRIESNGQMQKEQVEVMQDAKQLIQDQPGIYSTMLGNAPAGVTSGLAINSLVEQSLVSLGEVNDNYRYGRRMVGEALQALICDDLTDRDLKLMVGSGRTARVVVLNTFDDAGLPKNHVKDAPVKVGLQDVPSTPAYRMQQQQQISQALSNLGANPDALAVMSIAFVETMDMPNRDEYATFLRQRAGIPEPGTVDEAQRQQQEEAQKNAMLQAQAAATAKIERDKAAAIKDQSVARLNDARVEEIAVQVTTPAMPAAPEVNEDELIEQALAEANV